MREYSDYPPVEQSSPSNWHPVAWVQVTALLGAALLALGGFLALFNPVLLVGKGDHMNSAARVFAGYLVSRNLSLAALLVGALILRARKALGSLITLTALIQFVDAVVDFYEQRWAIVPVVVVIGLAFLIAARSTLGRPIWKIEAWRDS
jgi:hypothetical protein